MRKSVLGFLLLVVVFAMNGCSGASGTVSNQAGSAPMNLTVRDTPPAGVTILSLQLTIGGAVLQPGNVSILKEPADIEFEDLQTDSAFLSTTGVPAATYDKLELMFSSAELTILNNSGATIAGCTNGSVCELKPSLSPGMVSIGSSPFPLTVTANMPVGLEVDVNVATLVQNNLSLDPALAGAVTVNQLASAPMQGEMDDLGEVSGVVQTIGTNQFTITTLDGRTLTITTDANTQFDFEDSNCNADNVTCLTAGEAVEADVTLQGNGTLLAGEVSVEDQQNQQGLEGTVVAVTSGTQFKMVVLDEQPNEANVAVGNPIVVNLTNATTFSIGAEGLSVQGGLSFASSADLLVGQSVQVDVSGTPSPGPPITVTAAQVRLRSTQISGSVGSVNSSTQFTLTGLSSLFTSAGITTINVQVSDQTEFEDVNPASTSGLASGNPVSVRGLLFKTGGTPTLVAEKVRLRTGEGE